MVNSFKNSFVLLALIVASAGIMAGCATQQAPVIEPPAGKIGTISEFDIMQASEQDIAAALQRDGRVIISGGLLFAFDSAELNPQSQQITAKLAQVMIQNPNLKVAVVGNTDNTGNFKYNIGLSERRANAIVKAIEKDGVSSDRLVGVGVGSLDPIATNDTEQGRAQNRRVELVLIR